MHITKYASITASPFQINVMIFATKICLRSRLMLIMNLRRQVYLPPSFYDPWFGICLFLLLRMIYLALWCCICYFVICICLVWKIYFLQPDKYISFVFVFNWICWAVVLVLHHLLFWCTICKFRTWPPFSLSVRNICYSTLEKYSWEMQLRNTV